MIGRVGAVGMIRRLGALGMIRRVGAVGMIRRVGGSRKYDKYMLSYSNREPNLERQPHTLINYKVTFRRQ